MNKTKIIVIGGGASGIVAAITAAKCGANVTIIEQKGQLGKKILATGNGRCNLTNEQMNTSYYHGEDTSIIPLVLEQFGLTQTLDFFHDLGVLTKNKEGYIYPLSNQALTVLEALCLELKEQQVEIILNTKVQSIRKKNNLFQIETLCDSIPGEFFKGDAVILAAGSKASPVFGSDGSGYMLAKSLGHSLTPIVPSLVALRGKHIHFKKISGVRVEATITAIINNQDSFSNQGELQLTEYGISGIPVFQISRFVALALQLKKSVKVMIDFIPSITKTEFVVLLKDRLKKRNQQTIEEILIGIFPKKLIGFLLQEAQVKLHQKAYQLKEQELEKILQVCKEFSMEIQSTNSFEQAQVCAGGVRTTEINPCTMESNFVNNLFLTGEILDIDGICGGYNLQWAWSTGYIAGINAAKGIYNDKN